MPGQQPRDQARGDGNRPPTPRRTDSARSHSSAQPAVPSVETSESTVPNKRDSLQSPGRAQIPQFRVPQSAGSAPDDSQRSGSKVAIPRLKRSVDTDVDGATRSGGRHRVNHACEPCRNRKTKCSGERPTCKHCEDFNISCHYEDGKRDRVKKQFGSMSEKVAEYEKLLKDLSTRVSEVDARLIKASLDKEAIFDDDDALDNATIPSIESIPNGYESGAESDASGGAGSTGALDRTDEDFTRDQAKETGFMGKNSEITWLQRLRQENKYGDLSEDQEPGKPPASSAVSTISTKPKRVAGDYSGRLAELEQGFSVKESSYHLDDLSIFNNHYEAVDPYEYPTAETAQNLFNAYMRRVHPTFPIVGKANLSAQFEKFVSGKVARPPEKWLAIVNLIFAIGAKYSHDIQAEWKGDERDHRIYFTRARMLSIDADTMFQHADLQNIQIVGLISIYFLCISQINRAWTMTGIAIRWATALGMNMRSDSTQLKDSLKEIRYRVWWTLYTLEYRLCSLTGRTNCILNEHCTTPLPAPLEEDKFDTEDGPKFLNRDRQQGDRAPASNSYSPSATSRSTSSRSRSGTKTDKSRSPSAQQPSNLEWAKDAPPSSSLYFLYLVQLTRFTQGLFQKIYNPSAVKGSWSDIQSMIKDLGEQLEIWYRSLPTVLDFRRNQRDREFYESRLNLGFFYYGTKIMIHRPCLCRLDQKIPNQSIKSNDFNRQAAVTCVEAGRDMLRLLPDEPNAVGLIRVGPWWSILHWLVQSATVLMLEISFRSHHMPEEADALVEAAKKAVRWLHALGEDNVSARRAWKLCNSLFHDAAAKIGREFNDLPDRPPGPSTSPSQDDSTMSGVSRAYSGQHDAYGGMTDSMYPTSGGIHHSSYGHNALNLNQLTQYDQYFSQPMDQSMNQSMNHSMQFHHSDAELEFMSSSYHDGEGHQQGRGEQGDTPYN